MSYCRWSSNDFQCDVYVYADVAGGWTTHVASREHDMTGVELPEPVAYNGENFDEWYDRHGVVSKLLKKCELVPIGLPFDGWTFNDGTPGACAERLAQLKEAGYRVPQYAIDQLRFEEENPDL